MRRMPTLCAVLVGVAIGLAGPAATASTPPPPSKATLTARLLTAADAGKGWKEIPSAGFDSGLPRCLETIYLKAADQHAVSERSFVHGGGGDPNATAQDRLVSFNRRTAPARMKTFEKSVASCKGGNQGTTATAKAIRFHAVGQQSKGFLIALKQNGRVEVHAVIVLARQRATVVVSTYAETATATAKGEQFATAAIKKAA
jgi:hypothetical protein